MSKQGETLKLVTQVIFQWKQTKEKLENALSAVVSQIFMQKYFTRQSNTF